MFDFLKRHWPEYLMEAAGLGIFMVSAGVFTTLFEYPGSPLHTAIESPFLRRALIGLAMGLTAACLIYSPWGQQSGAHYNPAVTLTFLRLGKVAPWDAAFYVVFQALGGILGVLLVVAVFDGWFTEPPVSYVATVPGQGGSITAFLAETVISFGLMLMVLLTTNSRSLRRYTGVFAGVLITVYITIEAPFSGMSMNPARTLASAIPGRMLDALWVYVTAPFIGMLSAVEVYGAVKKSREVICAKLNHETERRCIFHCGYMEHAAETAKSELKSEKPAA